MVPTPEPLWQPNIHESDPFSQDVEWADPWAEEVPVMDGEAQR
jgi:hypothetical protein